MIILKDLILLRNIMEIDESHPLNYQITWSFEVLSFWKLLLFYYTTEALYRHGHITSFRFNNVIYYYLLLLPTAHWPSSQVIFTDYFCSYGEFIRSRCLDTSGSYAVCAGAIISARRAVTSSWGEVIFFCQNSYMWDGIPNHILASKCYSAVPWQGGDYVGISV